MFNHVRYWPTSDVQCPNGVSLELRTKLAWELITHYGLVAGVTKREDSSGRAILDVMDVPEVVSRAFALVDAFMALVENRGEIKPYSDDDAAKTFARGGELKKIMGESEYPRGRWNPLADMAGMKSPETGGKTE